ncbi:MAG: M20 family metallopeptidase [Bacteroidales bacterium]
MGLAEIIREKADSNFNEVIAIRRHIHMNPELSFKEYETSRFIADKLTEYGIEFRTVAETGILAWVTGRKNTSEKSIAIRSELDALPIREENETAYKSVRDGIMHACGHDVHSACLLGSARIIKSLEKDFSGTVYFIFQPGEESLPGGAIKMLDEDLFGDNKPDLIIAQHVLPEMGCGETGVRSGIYMASADEIYITVTGEGGHAAMPHNTTDTVVAMAQVIVALQQISSRFAPPHIPTVLSFGKLIANGATNVIPREVTLDGTFRTMDETWRARAHELITSIATKTASSLGAACMVEIRKGYPVLKNDPSRTELIKNLMKEYLGSDKVNDLPIRMTSEDFAWFAMKYPAVFYRLGTGMPDRKLHTPVFDIDEKAVITGTGLSAWLALSYLEDGA